MIMTLMAESQLKEKTVDGEACLELNDKINPDGKYTIYATNGTYTIEDYYFTFAGSYSRKVNVPGSATIQYATVDAWKDAAKERVSKLTFGSPEQGKDDQKTELASFTSGTSTLVFNSDKTGELNGFSGQVKQSFTWEVADGALSYLISYHLYLKSDSRRKRGRQWQLL